MKTVTEQENTMVRSPGLRNGLERNCSGLSPSQAAFSEEEPLSFLPPKAMFCCVVPHPNSMADPLKIEG